MLAMIMSNLLCVCYNRDIVFGIIYLVISIFIKLSLYYRSDNMFTVKYLENREEYLREKYLGLVSGSFLRFLWKKFVVGNTLRRHERIGDPGLRPPDRHTDVEILRRKAWA